MESNIKIKSRAVKVYDYHEADITDFVKGFVLDEEQYEKDLARILKRYGKKVEADTVSDGDTVTVTCVSELPRYNKAGLPVVIGRGLFGKDIEAELIGMNRGETKTVGKDGKPVSLTVDAVSHTVLPELSDENVASFGLDGISSVAELRRLLVAKQVEGFILEDENADMASAFVWQQVANNSTVERDHEEYEHFLKKAEKKVAEMAAFADAEDEENEEPEQEGVMDHDALVNMLVSELDLAAIGAGMMENAGISLSVEDYTANIDKLCEAYPDRTRDDIEKENTVLDFGVERFANYLAGEIDRYVADCFKAIITKQY